MKTIASEYKLNSLRKCINLKFVKINIVKLIEQPESCSVMLVRKIQ